MAELSPFLARYAAAALSADDAASPVGALIRDLAAVPAPERSRTALIRLSRKAEIAGKIARAYDADWRKPTDPNPIGPETGALLCAIFLDQTRSAGDPRYLNAALKMLDGVMREPDIRADIALRADAEKLADAIAGS